MIWKISKICNLKMENIRGLRDDEDFRWCVQFNAHALCMLKVSFDR